MDVDMDARDVHIAVDVDFAAYILPDTRVGRVQLSNRDFHHHIGCKKAHHFYFLRFVQFWVVVI